MAEEECCKAKWEGKCSVEVGGGIGAEQQAWEAIQDFCNFHKWIPIDSCYRVEGNEGQPGLIRYCAANYSIIKEEPPIIMWAQEKLLTIDPIQRSLSYQVCDNNMGFKYYVATFKVIPAAGARGDSRSCTIEWGFVCDPIEGWTFQALKSHLQHYLHFMANKIQNQTLSLSLV